jgi:puromycin-sensitive aminopeptidase
VKLNPGQSGLYRVAYSEELWRRLTGAVKAGALPTVDRLGLIDDAFALSRAGYVKTSAALGVLQAYERETDYSVWLTIAGILDSLDNLLSRESCRKKFQEAARQLLLPIAGRQGWDKRPTDGHLDVLLRSLALRNVGGYGDQSTIEEARSRFASYRRSGELDPNLRQAVYSLVAENGGEAEWEELQKLYHASDLHEEKIRVLRAAGSFRQPEMIEKVLQFAISDQVRSQDTPIVLANAAGNAVGRTLAWKCLKRNWKMFVERYHGGGLGLLSRLIGIPSGFTERRHLEDAEKFFRGHKVPGTERAVRKTIEFVRGNIAWIERDRKDLRTYFA